jgi:hypothetical protein
LITTKDSPDNKIDLIYEVNGSLNVAVKKEMNCIGDIDTLMMLKFFKVPENWLCDKIPEGCDNIMEMISKRHLRDIFCVDDDFDDDFDDESGDWASDCETDLI